MRRMPTWRKLHLAAELYQAQRQLALDGLRARYPGATEPALRRRLADLMLGPELARLAYGPADWA